jgi:hypothetical protein
MKIVFSAQYFRKGIYLILACLFLSSVFACTSSRTTTSTIPLVYTDDQRTKIAILGEILYESKDRIGYVGLLKAARNLYPDCDYVIDIMIDQRVTTTTETKSYFPLNIILFFLRDTQSVTTDTTWIMRGTAIKYVR